MINLIANAYSQNSIQLQAKPAINVSAIKNWPSLGYPIISNDGNFFLYVINNQPSGNNTLIIQSTKDKWEKRFIGSNTGFFSGDGKQAIFKYNDTLCFLKLGTDSLNKIFNIHSFKLPQGSNKEWIAYQHKNPKSELILYNLYTKERKIFSSVELYAFNNSGNTLLVSTNVKDSIFKTEVLWINLDSSNVKPKKIWSSIPSSISMSRINGFNFDELGSQVAFLVEEKSLDVFEKQSERVSTIGLPGKKIWYYKKGMENAELRVSNFSYGIDSGLLLNGSPQFSKNGRWIFFQMQSNTKIIKSDTVANINIWSYKDLILQPEQMRQLQLGPKTYTCVVSVNGGKVIQLYKDQEELKTFSNQINGDYVVVGEKYIEPWWKFDPQPSFYILSLKDGSRRIINTENGSILYMFSFSPTGRYLVYYNVKKQAYFSYDLVKGQNINITKSIPSKFCNEYASGVTHYAVAPVAGWLEGDSGVILYDNYDIWQVDPEGKKAGVNITNGLGLKHKLKLRLVYGNEAMLSKNNVVFKVKDSLLITAFSPVNKMNGFYRKVFGQKGNPELLSMGPYLMFRTKSQLPDYDNVFDNGLQPIKASDGLGWILSKQTASIPPNYYFTENFKVFKLLTNFEPQKSFNWLTSELVTWKQLDGTMSQGILYKPQNFDPQKKYPLIFNYYERLSHRLYEFPIPAFAEGDINIPWFVSNGYLVFTPDIHYKVASKSCKTVGEWAYNSIISATRYLSQKPYVDEKKIAIQGHSFGGLETNYLVTHSTIFAAACEAAGVTDPVSTYLTLIPAWTSSIEHLSRQEKLEVGHELYGATLWEKPNLYLKNSAVLNAHKVNTPLLIMHNVKDNNIQWRQGVELYMALRRLGKRVWMLQYEEGNHSVNGKDAEDYTIRLTQFFDHYLKGLPAPKWMTQGVPQWKKGIDTGFELDPIEGCGVNCQVCMKHRKSLVEKVNNK